MDVDVRDIAFVLKNNIHFRLPYFQRKYAWEKENWQTLWDDILELYNVYNDKNPPEHFMGSLVVIGDGNVNGTISAFKLLDGQQRLITISLILGALAFAIKKIQPELHKKIRNYIINCDEVGDVKAKILPTSKYSDRSNYLAILQEMPCQPDSTSKIPLAYDFYCSKINVAMEKDELDPNRLFLVIINSLKVVFINLNTNEKPYQVFESLNAKGKPLSQADLVRNYIAMKLPEDRQPEIFEKHWAEVENLLQEEHEVGKSRIGELPAFLRHYLAYRNGILGNKDHIYDRFRDRIETEFKSSSQFEGEIIAIKRFAGYYDHLLRPENEKSIRIRDALKRLNILEFSTGYPFLLAMFETRYLNEISEADFIDGLQILENYIIRRYLCAEPTNYLNKVFPSLWKFIDTTQFIPSLKTALLSRNYSADYKVRQEISTRHLYENKLQTKAKTILLFETINRYLSKKSKSDAYTILSNTPTIEHILPQNGEKNWKEELGEEYDRIIDQYLDTLGNLTIVTAAYNANLSNRSFAEKKPKLASQGLLLNSNYFCCDIPKWDEIAIKNRAEYLTEIILEIWPALGNPTPRKQQSKTMSDSKPVLLTFMGKDIKVNTWRDVAEQTTEIIIELADDFEQVSRTLPSYLSQKPNAIAFRKLSNGWYLNVNLSANSLQKYCQKIIQNTGLSIDDWDVKQEHKETN